MSKTNSRKALKITAITVAVAIGLLILIVGGYVIYVIAQYYRIEDNLSLEVKNNSRQQVEVGTQYTVTSYNLGFGAYSPEYSFFMDSGVMNDGTVVTGVNGKGLSKQDVQKNVNGQIDVAKNLATDFYFFQETDTSADRSYGINMVESITSAMDGYGYTFAENFHTANLLYPFNDPIGQSNSGLLTLSRYKVASSVRRSFPLTDSLIDKLFDLDRCFSLNYLPISGSDKFLVLLHLHMSAYDEGGLVRAQQLEMLNTVLSEERAKGNYVIAGGDFNHCLIADNFSSDEEALQHFKSQQKTPDWVKNSVIHKSEIADGYSIVAAMNAATCRGAEMPYQKDVNYTTVIDGFLVSDNVRVVTESTVDTQYAYSDHNPVRMTFVLK